MERSKLIVMALGLLAWTGCVSKPFIQVVLTKAPVNTAAMMPPLDVPVTVWRQTGRVGHGCTNDCPPMPVPTNYVLTFYADTNWNVQMHFGYPTQADLDRALQGAWNPAGCSWFIQAATNLNCPQWHTFWRCVEPINCGNSIPVTNDMSFGQVWFRTGYTL